MNSLLLSALAAVTLTFSFSANAADKVIANAGNWTLTESYSETDKTQTCTASAKSNFTVFGPRVLLQIAAKKGPRQLLEIMIRANGKKLAFNGAKLAVSDPSRYYHEDQLQLPTMGSTEASQYFWLIPSSTQTVISTFSRTKTVFATLTHATEKQQSRTFATKGLAEILVKMKTLCLGGVGSSNNEFERLFIPKAIEYKASEVSAETTRAMRTLYFGAHKIYLSRKDNKIALNKLRGQFGTAVPEYEGLTKLTSQLSTAKIPDLNKAIKTAESDRVNSERELPEVRGSFAGLEQRVKSTRATLDKHEAIIAPHQDEYARLNGNNDRNAQYLRESRTRKEEAQNQRSNLQREISTLDSEASSLSNQLQYDRSSLSSARSDVNSAERAVRTFDREGEIRRRESNAWGYENAVDANRALDEARRKLATKEADLSRAISDKERAESALSACTRTTGADCSSQRAEVSRAESARSSAKSSQEIANNEVNDKQDKISRIEDRIRTEVNSVYEALYKKEQDERSEMNEYESKVSSAEQRIASIRNSEIPSRRSQIDRLESEVTSLDRSIHQAQNSLDQSGRELSAFDQRTGWYSKKSAHDNASNDFYQRTQAFSEAKNRESSLVRTIATSKVDKPRFEQELVNAHALLEKSQARMSVVKTSLAPYLPKKAKHDEIEAGLLKQMTALSVQFASKATK